MPQQLTPEKSIFLQAMEIAAPVERAAYLDQACGNNRALRAEVESLLEAHDKPQALLDANHAVTMHLARPSVLDGPGTVIGPYKIYEQIGEGGFGIVFMAEQQKPIRRKVAIKIVKPGMDSRQVIARFEAERQALALMDHPNIAKVLDAGQTSTGRPYFVMELVKGLPITEFCDQGRLTPRERLELFANVCRAVQHAHQKGIIHRDLKPSNVLVTLQDGAPLVQVIDFGIAKALGQQLTDKTVLTGFAQTIGTPLYMPPEQTALSKADVDTRSDVYALGVLLYELLTGTTPFERERLHAAGYDEMRRIIREEEPPRPSTRLSTLAKGSLSTICEQRRADPRKLSAEVRGELDWIVMKCLEKDPNRRYESASALAADVQRYLDDLPVQALPPSAIYRLRKMLRRHKGAAIAACVILLLLVGGIVGTSWGLVQAEDARQAEGKRAEEAQAREAETKAVLEFVEKRIFAAARPEGREGGLGREVTLPRAIEASLPFLATSFPDQPLIEARLRQWVGTSFIHLGEARQAVEQCNLARAIYAKHRGPEHPDTLQTMNNLAICYANLGRNRDALKLFEETLALTRITLGRDHPETLTLMYNLACCYRVLGRDADALKLNEETLAVRKAKLGPDHLDTLASMNELALNYGLLGRGADALKLIEETLAIRKAKLGPEHPDTLSSIRNLVIGHASGGRYAEALKLCEELLPVMKTKFGPEHPETLGDMRLLSNLYRDLGRHGDALKVREEMLALRKAKLGPDDPATLGTMSLLAMSYYDVGRDGDALKLREERLTLMKAKLGLKDAEHSFVRAWLILSGPLPCEEDDLKVLDQQQVPDAALLRPRAGEAFQAGGKNLVWKEHHSKDVVLDFTTIYGPKSDNKLTYAVCYVHVDADRNDLALRIGSDDQATVTINGQQVFRQPAARSLELDEDEVKPIALRKGSNVLVFKVVNVNECWEGSLHFVGLDGRPAEGLRFGVEP
jgi:serine/threonine protein kinase